MSSRLTGRVKYYHFGCTFFTQSLCLCAFLYSYFWLASQRGVLQRIPLTRSRTSTICLQTLLPRWLRTLQNASTSLLPFTQTMQRRSVCNAAIVCYVRPGIFYPCFWHSSVPPFTSQCMTGTLLFL